MTGGGFHDVIWSGVRLTPGSKKNDLSAVGVTGADYVQEGSAEGTASPLGAYSQAHFAPRPESLPAATAGEYRNRPDYTSAISDLEGSAKRCRTGGWARSVSRPTLTASTSTIRRQRSRPTPSTTWPNIDGGAYVTQTNGSGKSEIYLLLPRYQFTAGGAYQLPYRINVAGSVMAREGFGQPFFATVESIDPSLPEKRVLLVDPDDNRLPGVFTLDLRAEKPWVPHRHLTLAPRTVHRDELRTTLGPPTTYDATATRRHRVLPRSSLMNPRLIRLGRRFVRAVGSGLLPHCFC